MPRFTIDIDDKTDKTLNDLADSRGSTKAEAVRAALASYSFLKRQIEKQPELKVSLTDGNDRVRKDIELP